MLLESHLFASYPRRTHGRPTTNTILSEDLDVLFEYQETGLADSLDPIHLTTQQGTWMQSP
jgi:hypothetical protein